MSDSVDPLPESPTPQPYFPIMTYRRRCREQACLKYFLERKVTFLRAVDEKDHEFVTQWAVAYLRIFEPNPWVEQILGLLSILILYAICHFVPIYFPNKIVQRHCISGIELLGMFLWRVWFTFRERLAVWVDFQLIHPYALVNECNRRCVKVLGVGDPAYSAAPLPHSWAGLTGRERLQPVWERDLCLILTLCASTILFIIALVMFMSVPFLYQLVLPSQPSRFVYWSITILFTPLSFINFFLVWRMGYIITNHVHRAMLYFGYNRDTAHPILRGFTDQMLHTYRVPKLPRLLEKQRDDAAGLKEE